MGLLAISVLLLSQGETDDATDLAREAADHLSVLERRAHGIRLRSLKNHRPELSGIDQLIDILTTPGADTSTS